MRSWHSKTCTQGTVRRRPKIRQKRPAPNCPCSGGSRCGKGALRKSEEVKGRIKRGLKTTVLHLREWAFLAACTIPSERNVQLLTAITSLIVGLENHQPINLSSQSIDHTPPRARFASSRKPGAPCRRRLPRADSQRASASSHDVFDRYQFALSIHPGN